MWGGGASMVGGWGWVGGGSGWRAAGLRPCGPGGAGRDRPPGRMPGPLADPVRAGVSPPCGGAERCRLDSVKKI
ncbi:hypothetical protein GCM10023259_043520 [Thermocatellispora tengchongensis]